MVITVVVAARVLGSLMAGASDRGSALIRALAQASLARHGLEDLDLFAGVRVLDQLAQVDHAQVAAVGPLLVVVMIGALGCGVEGIAGWRYSYLVHRPILSLCGPGPGELQPSRGAISLSDVFIMRLLYASVKGFSRFSCGFLVQ
jgi:hypothetical protein